MFGFKIYYKKGFKYEVSAGLSFIALFSLLYVEVFVLLVCCVFFSVNNEPVITDSHHMVEPPALLLCSSGEFHEDVSCIIVTAAPPRA